MIRPPQSPGWRWPAARDDVKTIGASAVPTALIFAPRMIMSDEPSVLKSPLIIVPGWIVSVAPLVTWMKPESVYAVSANSVRLAVMSLVIVAAKLPKRASWPRSRPTACCSPCRAR